MEHVLCGVEMVKVFVNVHLYCIVSNLKRLSNTSTLPTPGKISADVHDLDIGTAKIKTVLQWHIVRQESATQFE